jgi:hypothetical protein
MTPEKKVKNAVVDILKLYKNLYYFYPVMGGYGAAGIPDIVVCYRGYFIAVECKAGKGKTTALQDKNLKQIRDAEGVALVVNEENLQELQEILDVILQEE